MRLNAAAAGSLRAAWWSLQIALAKNWLALAKSNEERDTYRFRGFREYQL